MIGCLTETTTCVVAKPLVYQSSSVVGRERWCKFNPAMLFRLIIIVANSPVTNFPKGYYGKNYFSRYFNQFQLQN